MIRRILSVVGSCLHLLEEVSLLFSKLYFIIFYFSEWIYQGGEQSASQIEVSFLHWFLVCTLKPKIHYFYLCSSAYMFLYIFFIVESFTHLYIEFWSNIPIFFSSIAILSLHHFSSPISHVLYFSNQLSSFTDACICTIVRLSAGAQVASQEPHIFRFLQKNDFPPRKVSNY